MLLLVTFLSWLDALPARYWACVYFTSSLVVISALVAFHGRREWMRWNRPVLFGALLAVALLAFRWPMIFDNRPGNNPDESQMIAGSIVLKSDPIFWKSVDGTTHGPLVQLPLAILGAAGVRLDYTNARLVSSALIWSTLICVWLALRVPFGDGLARVLTVPLAVFEITLDFWDFNQYSSEHVSIALLAAATWLIVAETIGRPAPRPVLLGLAGLVLGAVPFAKLQGAPIGVWLGIAAFALILGNKEASWRERSRSCAWLIGGALVWPMLMTVMVLAHGIFHDFWISYVQSNLVYANEHPLRFGEAVQNLVTLVHSAGTFRAYYQPLAVLSLGAMVVCICLGWRSHRRFTVLAGGLLVVSIYATVAPNRLYTHYVQYLIVPSALLAGALIGTVIQKCDRRTPSQAIHRFPVLSFCLATLFIFVGCSRLIYEYSYREFDRVGIFSGTRGKLVVSPLARLMRDLTNEHDYIAMWGWEPHYFVEANRMHATREAHSALELFPSTVRDYYRNRYLNDLLSRNPPVFVDVTGPGTFFFEDRVQYGHETFPELANAIRDNFRLFAEIGSARIYLRNDRAEPVAALTH